MSAPPTLTHVITEDEHHMDRTLLTGRLPRLLAISLLMLGLLVLPAAGQEDGTTEDPATEEEAPTGEEDDSEDEESDTDDDSDEDSEGAPASRGNVRLDTGEVSGRLSPAVSQPGQQVVVHAVTQLFDHPGGGPDGVGGGRPDHAGPPEDRPDGQGSDEDPTDEDPTAEDGAEADDTTEDGAEADDTTDDGVVTEPDTSTDDQTLDVTFTVDYGDGTPVEDMRPTKTRGRDGARRAIAHHTFAEEGAYTVVITATPLEGEPATIELTAQVGSGAARLDGDSRIETAVAISQDSFEDGSADAVVLARADAFADALAASTLAFVSNAPVLLTGSEELPAIVQDEIERVLDGPGPVFLLGGEAAISATVEQSLIDLGHTVIRLSEDDRIGTALAIATFVLDNGLVPDQVVVAAAGDFPDALAGAAYAAANNAIIVLTDTDSLDSRVADLLAGLAPETELIVAGGEAAISTGTYAELEALGLPISRVAGESRYETAALLAQLGYTGGDTVVLATGTNYPDALAGAVYAASLGAPVLLVGETLPAPVIDFLTAHAATLDTVVTLGGEGAVSDVIIDEAMSYIAESEEDPIDDGIITDPDTSTEDGGGV